MITGHNTRIPKIASVELAVEMHASTPKMSRADIEKLFKVSKSKANQLKNLARQQMWADNAPCTNPRLVDTHSAYKAWGLDIDDLKKRLDELDRLRDRQCVRRNHPAEQ